MRRQLKNITNKSLTPKEKVDIARNPQRPNICDYIDNLFDEFFEIKGDRLCKEDSSILCGIAFFRGTPVTIVGHRKGRTLEENLNCNFGMPGPEGYRKALRAMKQAEKFNRPIITLIDTPGAYPGVEAEARGQSNAIAENLKEMSELKVPIITIVTGEGSSGGALALSVSDRIYMLENSIYSILSPEGFASILWKDASKSSQAAEKMKLTADDLYRFGIVEGIIKEPSGGAHLNPEAVYNEVSKVLDDSIAKLIKMSASSLVTARYRKFREIGIREEV